MKTGKSRTMSICLTDIPKERILKHENGKLYLNLQTWDNDEPDQYDNDFSLSIPLTKDEIEKKKNGEEIKRIYLGNGRIWEYKEKMQAATQEDTDDGLPF